ncbi:MAG: hypothetical protein CXZ00_11940 [Acidobacteria bacterium]|nr:MAG: hypothetical protein CXZ00_11940 [Acidobacteriota bacterium]
MDEGNNNIAHLMREEIARLEEELVQLKKRIANYQKSLAVLERGSVVRNNRAIVLVKEFLAEHPRSTFEQILAYLTIKSGLVGKTNLSTSLRMCLARSINFGTILEKDGQYSLKN